MTFYKLRIIAVPRARPVRMTGNSGDGGSNCAGIHKKVPREANEEVADSRFGRSAYFLDRNERSAVSCGSMETGWSRHSQRIISGSMAPPMLWLCTPIPHE